MTVSNINLIPVPELELTVLLGVAHIDAGRLDTPHMVITLLGIDDVEGLLAALEALLNEGKQHAVLFLRGVKEGANMPVFAETCTGDPYRLLWVGTEVLWWMIAVILWHYRLYRLI
jgi:hypothetical protein